MLTQSAVLVRQDKIFDMFFLLQALILDQAMLFFMWKIVKNLVLWDVTLCSFLGG